jgi:primary-amine oxidase
LTGILNVYTARSDEHLTYGTMVAPQINAQYHQHIFSLRVDPMVDGLHNSVVESDVFPVTDKSVSFAGNAFQVKNTVLKTEGEGARDFCYETDRRWRIVNPGRKHYASGQDTGYVVMMKGGATPLMAQPDSWIGKRGGYAKKALWVVKDVEGPKGGRMWPAGKYVPQTREEPEDSVPQWAKGEGNIDNEDILVYVTIGELLRCCRVTRCGRLLYDSFSGTTHIPRPEDWPVYVASTCVIPMPAFG